MKLSKKNQALIAKGKPPQPSEGEFKRQILELAKRRGWKSAHFRPGMDRRGKWQTAVQGDGEGFPDLILVRLSGVRAVIVAELKVGKNKPTAEQQDWLNAFASAGVPAYTWTPKDWLEIERVLNEGPLKRKAFTYLACPRKA